MAERALHVVDDPWKQLSERVKMRSKTAFQNRIPKSSPKKRISFVRGNADESCLLKEDGEVGEAEDGARRDAGRPLRSPALALFARNVACCCLALGHVSQRGWRAASWVTSQPPEQNAMDHPLLSKDRWTSKEGEHLLSFASERHADGFPFPRGQTGGSRRGARDESHHLGSFSVLHSSSSQY